MSEKEIWTAKQYREYVQSRSGRLGFKSNSTKKSPKGPSLSWDVQVPFIESYRPRIVSHIQPESLIWVPTVGKSTNKANGREHWATRDKDVKFWNELAKDAVDRQGIQPVQGPVFVMYYLLFGKGRQVYDWTNCSHTAKQFEDGLVRAGVFPDDKKQFINWGGLLAQKVPSLNCYTVVEIYDLDR
jgi:hypothetical protein